MGTGWNGTAPSRCRRSIAATLVFGVGLPQLAHGLLPSNMLLRGPAPACMSRSSRCGLRRSFPDKAASRMSAVSPEVVEQQEGDDDALSPLGDGGGVGGAASAATAASAVHQGGESEQPRNGQGGAGGGKQETRRSKWLWRRRKGEGEGKREQEEEDERVREEGTGNLEVDKQEEGGGRFTYDWDNGERVIWKASKKSKVQVVSSWLKLCVERESRRPERWNSRPRRRNERSPWRMICISLALLESSSHRGIGNAERRQSVHDLVFRVVDACERHESPNVFKS